MKVLKNYIETSLNLNSYSSSDGFAGYFSNKGRFSKSTARKAIKIFEDFWEMIGEETLLLASTLIIDVPLESLLEDYEYTPNDIEEYITPLLKKGFIQIQQIPQIKSDSEIDEKGSFRFYNVDKSELEYICKLFFIIMALGGVQGHLFVAFESENLILYPHDDIGFGIFSSTEDNAWIANFFDCVETKSFCVESVKNN